MLASISLMSGQEPRDSCPLIRLILASGAARHLLAHLPVTRHLSPAHKIVKIIRSYKSKYNLCKLLGTLPGLGSVASEWFWGMFGFFSVLFFFLSSHLILEVYVTRVTFVLLS